MKKIILGTLILALAGAGLQTARANDTTWKAIGTVAAIGAVADIVAGSIEANTPCTVAYGYPAPVYATPAVVYAPAPAPVVYAAPPAVVYAPAPVVVYRPSVVVYHPGFVVHRIGWHACW